METTDFLENNFSLPTEDIVKTHVDAPAVILLNGENSELAMHLQKRIPHCYLNINKDIRFILFAEDMLAQMKDDLRKAITEAWDNGAVIGCINPGNEWLKFYTALMCSTEKSGIQTVDKELMERFKNIDLHLAMANGTAFYQEKIYSPDMSRPIISICETVDENGDISHNSNAVMAVDNIPPTDYQWGLKAESIAKWINDKLEVKSKIFTRAVFDNSKVLTAETPVVWKPRVKVHYDVWGAGDYDLYPDVQVIINTRCAFSQKGDADVYDIEISEEFPANETWKGRYSLKKKAAYKYKLAGHSYIGPEVKLNLSGRNIKDKDILVYAPAPKNEPGSTSIAHDPGGLSFGANVMGSFTPGSKNSTGSKTGGGGFSMSYELPRDIMTNVVPDMPMEYSREGHDVKWKYEANGPYYKGPGGSNSELHEPALITKQNCITKQAVTFYISNSKGLGNTPVYLNIEIDFRTGWAEGTPWKDKKYTDNHLVKYSLPLPVVNRYFGRYTPTVEGTISDTNEWNNLHTMFKNGNLEYQTLCNENVQIGSPTADGLKNEAKAIWDRIIDQLIKTYGKTRTIHEYTVVLKDKDNNNTGSTLLISPKGWQKNKDRRIVLPY